MRLIYFLDYRFAQTPDGAVWTTTSYDAPFWNPYLNVFDHVTIVSRTYAVAEAEATWKRVDGQHISVHAIPYYVGPWQYATKRHRVKAAIAGVLKQDGAVILRAPGQLANCAYGELRKTGRTYAVENVGDGSAALARGVSTAHGRAVFQAYFAACQRRQNENAVASSYVANILEEKYPCLGQRTLVCSDVRLDSSWIRSGPRVFEGRAMNLITVATLTQPYKGLDVLLEAIARCHNLGVPLQLTLVGEGRLRGALEDQVRELGLEEAVHFTGAIPWGPKLMQQYDCADLFVLPSRVEAMPRAMIEAMARALPCIGTRVGAVPELIEARWIATAGDAWNLASLLLLLSTHPALLTSVSKRNLECAHQFSGELLLPMWDEFYHFVANATRASEQPAFNAPSNASFDQPARGEQR